MRIFIKSFGCSTNLADGEFLAGCLANAKYKLVDSVSAADVIIYNTCAVKGPTENRMIEILKRVSKRKMLIATGCLPLINLQRICRETRVNGIIGPAAGDKIVQVVKRVLNGEKVVDIEQALTSKPKLGLPQLHSNPVISIIPISYGCLGACAYCCVVFARGPLRSHRIKEIVEKVRRDLAIGIREFWLTSQDTACYGRDFNTNLVKLLNALCNLQGDFKFRVGMMTPNMTIDIQKELIQVFKSKKIYKFIHLPLQSGDDKVLKRMRRCYSVKDFKEIIKGFRKTFSDITLATDIICGFPGESKESFAKTLQLLCEIKPDIINVSKFFIRPRTTAARMQKDFVNPSEIKARSSSAASFIKKVMFERNQRWVGWIGDILIDEVGKRPFSWIGRNFAYKPIVVKSLDNLLGKTLHVKVVKTFPTYLEGTIIE